MTQRNQSVKLPKFTGRTYWDLLEQIKQVIREEPNRIVMEVVIDRGKPGEPNDVCGTPFPECGTQGCILGWGRVLTGDSVTRVPRSLENPFGDWCGPLAHALGDLFYGGTHSRYPWPLHELPQCEYAEKVCENIDKFMLEHGSELKQIEVRCGD